MRLMFWTHPSPPPATLRCHSSMALQFNHCKQTDGRCCCCCYDNLSNNLGVKSPFCSAEIVPCFIWKGFGVNGVTVQVVAEMRFRSLAAVDVPLSKRGQYDLTSLLACLRVWFFFFFASVCGRCNRSVWALMIYLMQHIKSDQIFPFGSDILLPSVHLCLWLLCKAVKHTHTAEPWPLPSKLQRQQRSCQ